jgi:hypothetical protein
MSNDYDAACRRMVRADPGAFLAWLIPGFADVARQRGWVDTRRIPFPGQGDQTGDLVFEVEILGDPQPPWAIPLEFQLEPDPAMFGRMLTFLGTLVNEKHPDDTRASEYQLGAAIINLTGTAKALPASRSFVWPGTKKGKKVGRCLIDLWERYLAEESAKLTLDRVARRQYHRALLPWLPLMAGGSEPNIIARCIKLARDLDEQKQADFGLHALIFAEKSADPGAWQKALEGWGVVKSTTVEKFRQEGQRRSLLRVLTSRTRQVVPDDLAEVIQSCSDSDKLDSWTDIAARIDTFDQFRQQAGLEATS